MCSVAGNIDAKAWLDHVLGIVGVGKGGGKADQAMASVPGERKIVTSIVDAANAYVASQ